MTDAVKWLVDAFSVMSGWEIFAALLGMGYVIFAAKEIKWCWPLAFVSTLIYTLLFWKDQLPMQAILNFYYMGMAIYGYMLWRRHEKTEQTLAISSWAWNKHLVFILTGGLLSAVTAYYLDITDTSQNPLLDASVTIFSVMNTWLMAKKILQNWLYWVVIDTAAIVLYAQAGYYATVILFSVYTVLATAGYLSWKKLYKQQSVLQ